MTFSPIAGLKFLSSRFGKLFVGEPKELAFRWAVLVVLALIGWWFVYPHLSAYNHSLRADRALAEQDCAQAQVHLENCLRVWPDSARLQFEMARCSWREGDPDAADRHLREAARLGWPIKAIDAESMLIEAQLGLLPALEASLAEMLKFAQVHDAELEALVLEALVLGLLRAGRPAESASMAKTLVDRDAGRWRSHRLLGQALEQQQPDPAAEAYLRSVELRPNQPKVHRWLALHQARAGNPRETLDHLRAAGAHDVETWLAEAKARLLLGQLAEARSALDRAWRDGADQHPWAWTLRGRLELDERGPAEAAPWLAQAEAAAPYHRETVDALIALAAREGCTEKVQHFQQRKQQSKAAAEEAKLLSKKMDGLYRQADASRQDKEATAFRLGELMFLTDHDEAGVIWMQSVLADNPDHPGAHRALAEYYQRRGAPAKADEHRRRLVKQQDLP